jgi:hypothetical protein
MIQTGFRSMASLVTISSIAFGHYLYRNARAKNGFWKHQTFGNQLLAMFYTSALLCAIKSIWAGGKLSPIR